MHNTFLITDEAWNKILAYARTCYEMMQMEIGGMAVILKKEEGWVIEDPVILEQEVSSTICHLDKEELANWYSSMAEKYKEYLGDNLKYLWWHSHHEMGASMSHTDWDTIRKANASISLVVNNKGDYELIYRGGDPQVEAKCKLKIVNEYDNTKDIKDDIAAKVTKEASSWSSQWTNKGIKPLRQELAQQQWINRNQSSLFEDNTVDYIMEEDPYDIDEKLEIIQLEIDQMLDMKEPYDIVHAYVTSQNAIYGDVFDLPDKKLFDAGKYKSYVDLMSLSNV